MLQVSLFKLIKTRHVISISLTMVTEKVGSVYYVDVKYIFLTKMNLWHISYRVKINIYGCFRSHGNYQKIKEMILKQDRIIESQLGESNSP